MKKVRLFWMGVAVVVSAAAVTINAVQGHALAVFFSIGLLVFCAVRFQEIWHEG